MFALCVSVAAVEAAETMDLPAAREFVATYCLDCHQGTEAEAGLALDKFSDSIDVVRDVAGWNKVAARVEQGEMPPADYDAPSVAERQAFAHWIRGTIHVAICDDGVDAGPPRLRRLNRTEYANTIRDLLGIHINAGHALPADGAGGEGFDNSAETLFISPMHAEKYIDAAKSALDHAVKDPRGRKRLISAEPSEDQTVAQAADKVLASFLKRAFRRPATVEEVSAYRELFNAAYEADASFDNAVQFALEAALVSPKFLFLWEEPCQGDAPELISQYEMASRLSYFLWTSTPDARLLQLADEGKLHDDEVLRGEVARMLESKVRRGLRRDAKVRAFAASFMEQWLGTRALGREFQPDPMFADVYDSELEGGMKYEPIFFLEDLLADNRSLLNLIDSDFTYVNRTLARHYKLKGDFREQPKRVELPEDSPRGGVLGMSSVLAVSSFPHRTSPVLRGKWILETLLGTPPPPPPPNVGELEENKEGEIGVSLRGRLEQHRASAQCASCHATMDPLGFGLENFDVLGRWRSQVDGNKVDAQGELPDGTKFEGPTELKRLLMDRKDLFIRNLTARMLGFALGRGLSNEDQCAVEVIADKLKADEYRAQTLVFEIVRSVPFRYKRSGRETSPGQTSKELTREP